MILTAKKLGHEIRKGNGSAADGIAIIPSPNLDQLEQSGEAAVNLRLGACPSNRKSPDRGE
jgi:hypothetical protein